MSTVDNELFEYSPITERPPIRWPGDARVTTSDEIAEHYQRTTGGHP